MDCYSKTNKRILRTKKEHKTLNNSKQTKNNSTTSKGVKQLC